jgi:hypothetical protein
MKHYAGTHRQISRTRRWSRNHAGREVDPWIAGLAVRLAKTRVVPLDQAYSLVERLFSAARDTYRAAGAPYGPGSAAVQRWIEEHQEPPIT